MSTSDITRSIHRALAGGAAFFAVVGPALGLLSGSWHVGLHGGFWIALAFTFWLESRLSL